MRITFVTLHDVKIPPQGYGAIDVLLFDYYNLLKEAGHYVSFISEQSSENLVSSVNREKPDVVYLIVMGHVQLAPMFESPVVILASPNPYQARYRYKNSSDPFYKDLFLPTVEQLKGIDKCYVFSLSTAIGEAYEVHGVPRDRIIFVSNWCNVEAFATSPAPSKKDTAICLGRIDQRKRQEYVLATGRKVHFVGPVVPPQTSLKNEGCSEMLYKLIRTHPEALGSWSRHEVHSKLNEYAAMVNVSTDEAHCCANMEGLAAGLSLVVSNANLPHFDSSLPFIFKVSEQDILDPQLLGQIIDEAIRKAAKWRKEPRDYCRENFSTQKVISEHIRVFENLLAKTG